MVFYDVQLSSLSVKTLADHLDLSNEFPDFCNGKNIGKFVAVVKTSSHVIY